MSWHRSSTSGERRRVQNPALVGKFYAWRAKKILARLDALDREAESLSGPMMSPQDNLRAVELSKKTVALREQLSRIDDKSF